MAATGGDPSDARLPRQDGDMVPAGATEHTASPTRDAAPWAAQPSAWLHCCWCHIGVICGRFPPDAETLRLNARVAVLDERMMGLVDVVPRFSRQLEEMDAQLAVVEDQMIIANTILRDQIVAHRRREGEGPRINAPPPPDERREGEGSRVKAPPPELLNERREEGRPRIKAPPPVPLNGR